MTVFEVVNSDDFFSYVEDKENKYSQQYVFVDFYAQWCGPCKRIAPFIEKLSEQYGDKFVFLKVDVDEVGECIKDYNVTSLPTFMIFERGNRESPYEPIIGANQVEIKKRIDSLVSDVKVEDEF